MASKLRDRRGQVQSIKRSRGYTLHSSDRRPIIRAKPASLWQEVVGDNNWRASQLLIGFERAVRPKQDVS